MLHNHEGSPPGSEGQPPSHASRLRLTYPSPARLDAELGTTRRETQKVTCQLSGEPQLKASLGPSARPINHSYATAPNPVQADLRLPLSTPAPAAAAPRRHPTPGPRATHILSRDQPWTLQVGSWVLVRNAHPPGPWGPQSGTPGGAQCSGFGRLSDNPFPKKPSGTRGLGMTVPESHCSSRCPARAQVSGSGLSHDKAPDQLDAILFQKTCTEIIARKK